MFGGIVLILGSLFAIKKYKKIKKNNTNISIPGSKEFFKEKELPIPREILIPVHGQEIANNSTRNDQNDSHEVVMNIDNHESIDGRIIQQLKQEVSEDLKNEVASQNNNQDNSLNIYRESGSFNIDKDVIKEEILQEIKQELRQSLSKEDKRSDGKEVIKEEILQEIKQELRKSLRKEDNRNDLLDISKENALFSIDDEVISKLREEALQDIKQELKQSLRSRVFTSNQNI